MHVCIEKGKGVSGKGKYHEISTTKPALMHEGRSR
jgi:hypothetical protein